jgi:ABC-2 type transport system ATP-binding protein
MIADAMLIIDKGKKVVEVRTDELLNPDKIQVEIITDNKLRTLGILKESKWSGDLVDTANGSIILEMQKTNIPELNRMLVEQNVNIFSLKPKQTLEDFFLSVTGA